MIKCATIKLAHLMITLAHLIIRHATADRLIARAQNEKFNMAEVRKMIALLLRDICRNLSERNLRQDELDHPFYTVERVEHHYVLK